MARPRADWLLVFAVVVFLVVAQLWVSISSRGSDVPYDGAAPLDSVAGPTGDNFLPMSDDLWQYEPPFSKAIRRWGCNRTETPFIFVHVGKSGGGSVRARLDASCLNYTKGRPGQVDGSYYPISNTTKARSCWSCFSHHLPSGERTFEGTATCHASTPIGQAIACPETVGRLDRARHIECDPRSEFCRVIYLGHNMFGSEVHWLPSAYLAKWWSTRWQNANDAVAPLWDTLHPNHTWCPSHKAKRPDSSRKYNKLYEKCSIPLSREVDAKAVQAVSGTTHGVVTSWSPLYASLPVLRVTVIRDPFSWLISKYFWHRKKHDKERNSTCDNLEEAVLGNNGIPRPNTLDMDNAGPGWLTRMSLGYIMYLCGEDCIVRYFAGTATLDDLELQAAQNLRQGFAVVGLLDSLGLFYDMITARVQYMNTSLNPHVVGSSHGTGNSKEVEKCRELFQDPKVQSKLLKKSPELRVLKRLYDVAVEVNRFQVKELQQCSTDNLVVLSNADTG